MAISPEPRDLGSRIQRIETKMATLTNRTPSLPHLAVPLYRLWSPATQTGTTAAYASAPASSVVGMGTLWEGRIDFGSQPCLSVIGVWGDLDAVVTITYQIKVGTLTQTWVAVGQQAAKHLVDITSLLGESDLQVTLSVVDVGMATGTDRILVQPLGVYLRQVPADGIFG